MSAAQIAHLAVVVGRLEIDAEHVRPELSRAGSSTRIVIPIGSARARMTSSTCGKTRSETTNVVAVGRLRHALEQRHRLGRGRRLVEERRIRHRHPRQIAHHRLEIEQRFEAALRDFGLIGRVGRVPAGILEHVALDDGRRDRVVVPEADVAPEHAVRRGDFAQPLVIAELGLGLRQRERRRQADIGRDDLVNQGIERARADDAEHPLDVLVARTEVSFLKSVGHVYLTRLL